MKSAAALSISALVALGAVAFWRSTGGARDGAASAPRERPSNDREAEGGAKDDGVPPSPAGGTITGEVVYEPDPERPWRLGRYYYTRAGGESASLAEAVVALRPIGRTAGAERRTRPREVTVDQVNYQFVPETTAIREGDSVRFTNSDPGVHNVRTTDGERPFNFSIASGEDHARTFRRAGGIEHPIRLGCVYHGSMRAWLYVFDHPWFGVTGKDGRFVFEDVPAGPYRLEVAHPAGELRWSREVEIAAGETARVDVRLSPDDLGARSPESGAGPGGGQR